LFSIIKNNYLHVKSLKFNLIWYKFIISLTDANIYCDENRLFSLAKNIFL